MGSVTVGDIKGTGFKYEQTAQEQETLPLEGTVAAILGTAHWGPINTPKYITEGITEFKNIFGDISSGYDEGHVAALYHFRQSALGYFTRISDGTEKKSYYIAKHPDASAESVGATVAPGVVVLESGTSDVLSIQIEDISEGLNETIPITFTGSALATSASSNVSSTTSTFVGNNTDNTPLNGTTYSLDITIDGTTYQLATIDLSAAADWDAVAAEIEADLQALTSGSETVVIAGGLIVISSVTVGVTSDVTIAAGTGGGTELLGAIDGLATYTTTVDNATNSPGQNSNETEIVSQINTEIVANATISTDYPTYIAPCSIYTSGADINKIAIIGPTTGSDTTITISGTANGVLSFATPVSGADGKQLGTFTAKYDGRKGNLISVDYVKTSATENELKIYFDSVLAASLVNINFDFTVDDSQFITNAINNELNLQEIVTYTHGVDQDGITLSPAVVDTDVYPDTLVASLANGASGDTGVDVTTDLIPEVTKYNNVNVYDFDIIGTPGYPDETVQDELQAVASKRQDVLALFDTPSLSVSQLINWMDGNASLGRDTRLNSDYVALYYPFVKVRKKLYDTVETKTTNDLGDYSPLTRVFAGIARSDALTNNKFWAPAGIRTAMNDIEGLQYTIDDDAHDSIYADAYDRVANIVTYTNEDGFFIKGQKTGLRKNANGKLTALSRINVARSGMYIKRQIFKQSKFFMWGPADDIIRDDFKKMIVRILDYLVSVRAIEDNYIVICDKSNNPASIRNNKGLVSDFDWTPLKSVERVKCYSNIKESGDTIVSIV